MRLVTFRRDGSSRAGVMAGDDLIDLGHPSLAPRLGIEARDVADLLAGGDKVMSAVRRVLDEAQSGTALEALRGQGAVLAGGSAKLLSPLPRPAIILSGGRAYKQHTREMQGAGAVSSGHPHAFIKNASSVIGPGEPIRLPAHCPDKIDYEGEFSIVIGRYCHNVSVKDAKSYIGGYTLINDVSARDWNPPKGGTPDWDLIHMGKQFPTFCPMGPAVATADEIADPDKVRLVTRLNGKVMQDACTDDLVFPVAEIIAYFSKWYPFHPGDVITTGTPSGVGFARTPPVFMKAGDVVSVTVEAIGELSNPVTGPDAR